MTVTQAASIIGALAERRTFNAGAMIVIAHPDDETIGMGAQLSRFEDALLVLVTDGAPRDGRDAAAHGFATVAEYASARREELAAAFRAGEARGIKTDIIGIPDRETHLNLSALIIELFARLQSECPEVVFVQPYEGGHPDHDAASFAVNVACRLSKGQGRLLPAIIEMTAYHAQGDGLEREFSDRSAAAHHFDARRPRALAKASHDRLFCVATRVAGRLRHRDGALSRSAGL
jgi:LmbE family N-acetylglucosaminyl deacetylase